MLPWKPPKPLPLGGWVGAPVPMVANGLVVAGVLNEDEKLKDEAPPPPPKANGVEPWDDWFD